MDICVPSSNAFTLAPSRQLVPEKEGAPVLFVSYSDGTVESLLLDNEEQELVCMYSHAVEKFFADVFSLLCFEVSGVSVMEVDEPPQAGCDCSIGQPVRTAASSAGGQQSRDQIHRTTELEANSGPWLVDLIVC